MKKKARIKRPIIYSVIMFLSISFFGFQILRNSSKLNLLRAEKEKIQSNISVEEDRELQIENQAEYRQSDEFIEKVVREKLGLIKPDEIIFVR